MLLLSSGYSKDMTNCRKLGEMNNNINGQIMYSTGLYMCLELPNQEVEPTKTNLLDYSNQENSDDNQFLSNSSISNSQNYTNSSLNLNALYNSSHIIKNVTNNSISLTSTPSSVPTMPSTTTPSQTTTPSPSTTTPSPITTTPSPLTTTPLPITTPSPSSTTKKPPDPITTKPPDPITPSSKPIDNFPDKASLQNNTHHSEHYNESPAPNITLENNPLLPIVITLASVILLVFCCACCRFLYNQKKIKKIFTNNTVKTDKKDEPDLESGEKKNRNSWTFSHKNMAQQKLRAMEQFKKSSRGKNRRLKKPEMKPRLKQVSKKQQEFINKQNAQKTPPDPKIAAAALKGLSRENKKKVRETLMERAKDIPGGRNNPSLQKMLNRFPETPTEEMDDTTKKWYKEEFQAELDHLDIMNNKPLTPPPPLPVPTFNQQTQPPVRRVYGNPNNKSSPKMTINEINPESPVRN